MYAALQGEVINLHKRTLPGVFRARSESGQKTVFTIAGECCRCDSVVGGGINVSIRLWTVRTDDLSVWGFSPLMSIKNLLASVPFVLVHMRTVTLPLVKPFTRASLKK